MMCSNKKLLLTVWLLVLLLYSCNQSAAISNYDCCLGYTRRTIKIRHLLGFVRQHANEACDIDAIIFLMKNSKLICADPKTHWVKEAVHVLSKGGREM